jgi:hypothetical protein
VTRVSIQGILLIVAIQPAHAQSDVAVRMQAWSTSLGVECTHCHVDGRWRDESKPAFDFARRMGRMVDGLNAGSLKAIGTITCWTCHRGRTIPARLPRASWERILADHQSEFEGTNEKYGMGMSVRSASLGVDCSHCHEGDRAADTKPAKAMVAKMMPIFDEIPKYFDDSRRPVTQCFMCHQGRPKPER